MTNRLLLSTLSLSFLLTGSVLGCGEDASLPEPDRNEVPPPRNLTASSPSEPPLVVAPPPRSKIVGAVATDLDEVLRDRAITLVDARGARLDAVTDESGGFVFDEVVTPYDLVVAGAPSSGPTVLLGLKRTDPYVEVFERNGPPRTNAQTQTVTVGLRPNTCPQGAGTIYVLTSSPSGGGAVTLSCDGSAPVSVEVPHSFRVANVGNKETLDVHVLVSNEARTSFAYLRKSGIAVRPGNATHVGMMEPLPVASSDNLVLGAEEGALEGWSWTTEVALEADGAPPNGFVFALATQPNEMMKVPLIPGLVMRTTVAAVHPRFDGRGGVHRSSRAWSGPTWLGAVKPLLAMSAGAEMTRPLPGSIFSRHGTGYAWKATDAALSTLTVTDSVRGVTRYRIVTEGTDVTLARLSMLGVAGMLLGDHTLDLSSSPWMLVDEVCSPDRALRRANGEETREGSTTRLRFPFQVVQ